jgi:hypothetical protein
VGAFFHGHPVVENIAGKHDARCTNGAFHLAANYDLFGLDVAGNGAVLANRETQLTSPFM